MMIIMMNKMVEVDLYIVMRLDCLHFVTGRAEVLVKTLAGKGWVDICCILIPSSSSSLLKSCQSSGIAARIWNCVSIQKHNHHPKTNLQRTNGFGFPQRSHGGEGGKAAVWLPPPELIMIMRRIMMMIMMMMMVIMMMIYILWWSVCLSVTKNDHFLKRSVCLFVCL